MEDFYAVASRFVDTLDPVETGRGSGTLYDVDTQLRILSTYAPKKVYEAAGRLFAMLSYPRLNGDSSLELFEESNYAARVLQV